MNDDWITLTEACSLLKVSRPTLNSYRKKRKLKEFQFRGRTQLSKTDIIKKVILKSPSGARPNLTIFERDFELVQPLRGIFDLRNIEAIDAYGVMTLLCAIKSHLKEKEDNNVHLILDDSLGCSYLDSIGFFTEVMRSHSSRVFANSDDVVKRSQSRVTVILPLHLIGYRGAEKKILDELYDPLLKQGFTEAYCGHIGWIVGELCDNAHTHSNGPCYLVIESLPAESSQTRYLSLAIGDIGVGIPDSLKTNPTYASMQDEVLLPLAFQSEISRMNVEPKRGKGLNDVISVAKGNQSWLRVDSNQQGLFFDFRNSGERVMYSKPKINANGTRFCLLLVDAEFRRVSREEVNKLMKNFMETA